VGKIWGGRGDKKKKRNVRPAKNLGAAGGGVGKKNKLKNRTQQGFIEKGLIIRWEENQGKRTLNGDNHVKGKRESTSPHNGGEKKIRETGKRDLGRRKEGKVGVRRLQK